MNTKFEKDINKTCLPFFSINTTVSGESTNKKINRFVKLMIKKKIDYSYISSGENVCWLLNIRGKDLPNSPIANCKIIITKNKYIFSDKEKIKKIKFNLKKLNIYFLKENNILKCLDNLQTGNFSIDKKNLLSFEESLINYKFKIIEKEDPIYILKSLKIRQRLNI